MTDNQEEKNSDNTPNNPSSGASHDTTGSNTPYSGDEQPSTHKTTSHKHKEQDKTIIVNVAHPVIDRTDVIEANKASWWSVKVNAGLFVCTVILAGISIIQAISSNNSAKTAYKTYLADSINNERILSSQKIAARKSDSLDSVKYIRDTSAFNLQKKSVQGQIDAINQAGDFFKKENEPFLQFGIIDNWYVKDFDYMKFTYNIDNLSKRVVYVLKETQSYRPILEKNSKDSAMFVNNPFKNAQTSYANEYISPNAPFAKYFQSSKKMGTGWKNAFDSQTVGFFLAAKFEYVNYITNKKRIYFFIVKIKQILGQVNGKSALYIEFIKNGNYDIK